MPRSWGRACQQACISGLDAVVEAVDQRRKPDAQLSHARIGNGDSLRLVLGTAKLNDIAHVGLHRPQVSGMRLKNINGIEADLVAVLPGEFVQGGKLPPISLFSRLNFKKL